MPAKQQRGQPGKNQFLVDDLQQAEPQNHPENGCRRPEEAATGGKHRHQFATSAHLGEREGDGADGDQSVQVGIELEELGPMKIECKQEGHRQSTDQSNILGQAITCHFVEPFKVQNDIDRCCEQVQQQEEDEEIHQHPYHDVTIKNLHEQ